MKKKIGWWGGYPLSDSRIIREAKQILKDTLLFNDESLLNSNDYCWGCYNDAVFLAEQLYCESIIEKKKK